MFPILHTIYVSKNTPCLLIITEISGLFLFEQSIKTQDRENYLVIKQEGIKMEFNIIKIDDLIKDAKIALEAGAYFSSLMLTFALVSECAKIEYPDDWFEKNAEADEYLKEHFHRNYKNGKYNNKNHDKERFVMWIDDWSNSHNCKDAKLAEDMKEYEKQMENMRKLSDKKMPCINGELLYQLRCNLFHEGSINIEFSDEKKITDNGNSRIQNKNIALKIDNSNKFDIHLHVFFIRKDNDREESGMYININELIYSLLSMVKKYYNDHDNTLFNTIKVFDSRK